MLIGFYPCILNLITSFYIVLYNAIAARHHSVESELQDPLPFGSASQEKSLDPLPMPHKIQFGFQIPFRSAIPVHSPFTYN